MVFLPRTDSFQGLFGVFADSLPRLVGVIGRQYLSQHRSAQPRS